MLIQLSGIVTYYSSLIPSEHNININCCNPMCKSYIKTFIWYFQVAGPYPLCIIKTHFLISQNVTWLFTQVYEALLFHIFLQRFIPREDAGGLSREYVLRIPSVS